MKGFETNLGFEPSTCGRITLLAIIRIVERISGPDPFFFIVDLDMAVPKKRKSKSKSNSRKHIWKRQLVKEAAKALSLGKAIVGGRSRFIR